MIDKLIAHIRKKLVEKDEILDYFDVANDEQIKYIMLATIEIVNEQCQDCFYCRNYKGFSLRSQCRIKPDVQDNCFHFTLDVSKVLKKKYYNILITTQECTRGKRLIDKYLSQKTIKNIIYESIRLSEILRDFGEISEGIDRECFDSID